VTSGDLIVRCAPKQPTENSVDFQVEPPNEQSSEPSNDLKMVNFSNLPNPPCGLVNSVDSQVSMALIPVVIEVIYKMNWLVCFVGGLAMVHWR